MSIIELIKFIFLGMVQGITEILPISSSGHVVVLSEVFSIQSDTGYFLSTLLNLGSFLVIIIFFRKFGAGLFKGLWKYVVKKDRSEDVVRNFKYFIAIIIATIPVAVIGLFLHDDFESYSGSYMLLTGIGFFVTASLLYLSKDKVNKYTSTKVTLRDGIVIGLLQPIALLPGLSRLGLTTCTGLFRQKSMETSLTFSILLYVPISLGQLILSIRNLMVNPNAFNIAGSTLIYYLSAFVASVIFTYLALKWIFIWVRKGSFNYFAIYNFVVGLLAFVYGIIII